MKKVLIEWEDSVSLEGWHEMERVLTDLQNKKLVKSVGIFISETDDDVTIAQSLHDQQVQHTTRIPKKTIKSMAALTALAILLSLVSLWFAFNPTQTTLTRAIENYQLFLYDQ